MKYKTLKDKLCQKAINVITRLKTTSGEYSMKTFKEKLDHDMIPRMHYAYGAYNAAIQAKRLGFEKISVIEFGVFTGHGLLDLENIAIEIEKDVGLEIDVFGFDSGNGMPAPEDYRDMPYIWQKGFFCIDAENVQKQLKKAKLIIGDVAQTVHDFIKREPAPISFISFDLDYYSSTVKAFELFNYPDKHFLPRVFCYFDDIIGDDEELHSEYTGELLAINEFNEKNKMKKISPVHGLNNKRIHPAGWTDHIFVFHIFDHPFYCKFINTDKNW